MDSSLSGEGGGGLGGRHFYIYTPVGSCKVLLPGLPACPSFPASPSAISTSAITHCRQGAGPSLLAPL